MKAISQFVVRVFDLIEAEGRTLRSVVQEAVRDEGARIQTAVNNLLLTVAFLVIAVACVLGGFGLIACGMLRWLETHISSPAALALTGVAAASLGGVGLYLYRNSASGSDK